MTSTAKRTIAHLLRQARSWFSPHPAREDAVSVEADPREVRRWMEHTDHALLDEAPAPPANGRPA